MIPQTCSRCGSTAIFTPDGRLAPWCAKCGADVVITTDEDRRPEPVVTAKDEEEPLSVGLPRLISTEARVYAHPKCGGLTGVSGIEFQTLDNPFSWITVTFCCGCGKYVG